jgi:hypothetical protein
MVQAAETAPSTPLPRLGLADFGPELAQRLEPRVKRLGYLGEFFQCAAHQPEALCAFMDFTESCKHGLPDRLTEVAALTVASWMGNAYERHQHERLSVRLGLGRDWVAGVVALQPDRATAIDAQDRQVQRLVLRILDTRGQDATAAFEDAVASFGPAAAIALLMVVGRYVTHALIVNTLALAPPVPSIFEDGFAG